MSDSPPDAPLGHPDPGRLAHPLALPQGSALAKVDPLGMAPLAKVDPLGMAPLAIDYLPVDNHRALLHQWRTLHPVQQLIIGSALGMALGTAVMTQMANARPTTAFAPSRVNHGPTARLTQTTVKALVDRLEAGPPSPDIPTITRPAPEGQPWLHPVMVDRFYLPTAPGHGGDGASPTLVVDRFYFDPSAWERDSPDPQIALAQDVVEVSPPARVPPPPPMAPPPPWEQPTVVVPPPPPGQPWAPRFHPCPPSPPLPPRCIA